MSINVGAGLGATSLSAPDGTTMLPVTGLVSKAGRIFAVLSPDGTTLPVSGMSSGVTSRGQFRLGGIVGMSAGQTTVRTCTIKVEAEAPFSAIRITICGKDTAAASTAWKAVGAATSTAARTNANTLFNPTQDGSTFVTTLASSGTPFGWKAFTFAGAATGTVPQATSALLPTFLQSDWLPISSVARTDGGTRPLALVRVFHDGSLNGAHTIMTGLQTNGGYADQIVKPWFRYWDGAQGVNGVDGITDLTQNPGSLASGTCFWVTVEFAYTTGKARTVLGVGDSIMESNATQLPGNVYGCYGLRGCALASTPAAPISWINSGMSSQNSATYLAAGLAAITQFKPTDVLYQAFSPNDAVAGTFETDAQMTRVQQMLDASRAANARLLLVTGVPDENYTLAVDNVRKNFNNAIRALCATGVATLVDYDAAVSDNGSPAKFITTNGGKFDNIHPGDGLMDLGAAVLRDALWGSA